MLRNMSDPSPTVTSTQTRFMPQSTDALTEAQAAQNAWAGDDRVSTAPSLTTQITAHTVTLASDEPHASSSSTSSNTPSTEPIESDVSNDEEEFGPFVSASTSPFKQPIYPAVQESESATLLNTQSDPSQQIGLFVGVGLVESVRIYLDTSARDLRRAGKLALRKLQIAREKQAIETTAKQLWDDGIKSLPHATFEEAKELSTDFVHEHVRAKRADEAGSARPVHTLNGVMHPVSFAPPMFTKDQRDEIDQMMNHERRVWDGPSA